MKILLSACVFLVGVAGWANEIARWDPNMALGSAAVDANGVKWLDGRNLPIEGRVFTDTELPYDRLPANVTTNVNGGVRYAKHHTSGMLLRLTTDSRRLVFKWTPFSDSLAMDHMPATGVSGIDVYRWDEARARWLYVKTGRITSPDGATLDLPWTPGTPFLVNFPLYNGLKDFAVGIDRNATVSPFPHRSGVEKPVVFYGTSITHGGCCSRPGLAFVNWIGRELDVPVVGLGFSGSGVMEYEMSEHLARIDASCYVLDCLWNMGSLAAGDKPGRTVEENYERFIRNLRAKRPDVPIVMAESADVYFGETPRSAHHRFKDRFAYALYNRLIAEGWKRLHWLPRDKMFSGDFEGTVDGAHPNDLGMRTLATAYGEAVRKALWPASSTRLPEKEITTPWIGCADDGKEETAFFRFRCPFVASGDEIRLMVSADERYVLFLDGREVARGPDRGLVSHWTARPLTIRPAAGSHELSAVVWRMGEKAPIAQLSYRGGSFLLRAEGTADAQLTTGKGAWEAARVTGCAAGTGSDRGGTYGVGWPVTETGASPFAAEGLKYRPAVVVRGEAGRLSYSLVDKGWKVFPTRLPPQTLERQIQLSDRLPLEVPARTKRIFQWRLNGYACGYPELTVSGGKGAKIRWGWTESLRTKDGKKRSRGADGNLVWSEKDAFTDTFLPDGRDHALFTTPWWRPGLWCRLVVETGDEPVKLEQASILTTGYPLRDEASFACDDPSLAPIREMCLRTLRACSHEMNFDCPFYEQQMYPGDARIQAQTLGAVSSDPRLVLNDIALFDYDRRPNGMVAMNFPTRGIQESSTYTLCWAMMVVDAMRTRDCRAWLAERLPGLRHTLSVFERYEDEDGLLHDLPGWSFADWTPTPGWNLGVPPGGDAGAFVNLYRLLVLRGAAEVEAALGSQAMAVVWRDAANRIAGACHRRFWDEKRGLFADTAAHDSYSEHVQCLALLAEAVSGTEAKRCFEGLVTAKDLARTTVYFSHHLFETYFKFGRGDLFLKGLDLWRDYLKMDLTTVPEHPGEPRSDCHAWGAHPLSFMTTGLAGIRSAAPFYARVEIAPSPGALRQIRATAPTPRGPVAVDLAFDGTAVSGTVETPVPGVFTWQGVRMDLGIGRTTIKLKGTNK